MQPRVGRTLRAVSRFGLLSAGFALAGTAIAGPREAELALAAAARPSVARVRWRDARFSDLTSVRNAVVVRSDGLLLMAGPPPSRHGTLTVTLFDGREMRAKFLAGDAQTALSLVRVPTAGLRPLALTPEPKPVMQVPTAASSAFAPRPLVMPAIGMRVVMVTGDGAIAMGSVRACGRYGSVTLATRERVRMTGLVAAAMAAIDTDAGSPLLDPKGRVAGLVVGRRTKVAPEPGEPRPRPGLTVRPEPVEAVAVPAAVIRIVWPLLEKQGRVPRGSLGVTTTHVDDTLREHLGVVGGGHLVRQVDPRGAAARAGVQVHDVILGVNTVAIRPGTSLHDILLPFRPGARVQLDVIRAGRRLRVPAALDAR